MTSCPKFEEIPNTFSMVCIDREIEGQPDNIVPPDTAVTGVWYTSSTECRYCSNVF